MQGRDGGQPESPKPYYLRTVLTGKVQPIGPHGERSAIWKQPRLGRVFVDEYGLSGDQQGDHRYHGGLEKAVHHYAFDHYAQWKSDFPSRASLFEAPGLFGENFSSIGLTEANVYVGDTFQVGAAVLQVSQARQPCWKLNVRTSISTMAIKVQTTARTGWYYRVMQPGWVKSGDAFKLLRRPNPDWNLIKLLHYLYTESLNRSALAEIADLPFLSDSWRKLAKTRLDTNVVEGWSGRLNTPEAP